jgi:hypothetical protein
MKKTIVLFIVAALIRLPYPVYADTNTGSWWEVQSIDTVKYSRDLSHEKLKDKDFAEVVDMQLRQIANVGATHVAIGTPYDEEFLPMLELWVKTARKYDLNVWFRGNFAGWEGWFGYEQILRQEHLNKTREFILANGSLFADGDIFTACPECENGGPGDPRDTGDVDGHRNFLIQEYQITADSFRKIGKNVKSNFVSMNADIARLVYDPKTTAALGGLVVIDHYVTSPKQLAKDIKDLAASSNGKIVLGEFGAPIPDIHGHMDEEAQYNWLEAAFEDLIEISELFGVNYWVNVGGSAALWSEKGVPREAVSVISHYYQPKVLRLRVINELDRPIQLAKVSVGIKESYSDSKGYTEIPYYAQDPLVDVSASGYTSKESKLSSLRYLNKVVLKKNRPNVLFKLLKFLYRLFS